MTISDDDYIYLQDLVQDRIGICLDNTKKYLVETRLKNIASDQGYKSVGAFINFLRSQYFSNIHMQAIEAFTTNETFFFRETSVFDDLKKYIIPKLIEQKKKQKTLTIWSAACSNGQEPYSIAIILLESFAALLEGWTVNIIASDLSRIALNKACCGNYLDVEMKRGISPVHVQKYFTKTGKYWTINKNLQNSIEFRRINLIEPWPSLPRMDLVLMRNVLIYFNETNKKKTLEKVSKILDTNGFLLMGTGESPHIICKRLQRTTINRTVLYNLLAPVYQNIKPEPITLNS